MADLEFDASGNLYGVGSIGGPQLYSINPATAQATVIGSTGLTSTTGGGLAIDRGGHRVRNPHLHPLRHLQLATGAYTNIANPAKPTGGGAYGALSFGGGILFGLNVGSGSPPPTALVAFNPATGATTLIGTTLNSLDAIAYVPEPGTASVIALGAVVALGRRVRHQRAVVTSHHDIVTNERPRRL
jgi:hypothetical protein